MSTSKNIPLEKQIKALELKYGTKKVEKAVEEMLRRRTIKLSVPYRKGLKHQWIYQLYSISRRGKEAVQNLRKT